MPSRITTELLLDLYRNGVFPMADARDDPNIFVINPEQRGILPLETFHVPRRLARTFKQAPYRITHDASFERVIRACAATVSNRPSTWINDEIIETYFDLHEEGHAHSIECWRGDDLVGGLYGVHIGGAFFGESMFSRSTDASKIALVALVQHLKARGFTLLDAQFHNPHLEQFGLITISRDDFQARLARALDVDAKF